MAAACVMAGETVHYDLIFSRKAVLECQQLCILKGESQPPPTATTISMVSPS